MRLLLLVMFLLLLVLLFGCLRAGQRVHGLSGRVTRLMGNGSRGVLSVSLVSGSLRRLTKVLGRCGSGRERLVTDALHRRGCLGRSVTGVSRSLQAPLAIVLKRLRLLEGRALASGRRRQVRAVFRGTREVGRLMRAFCSLSVLSTRRVAPQQRSFGLSGLLVGLVARGTPTLRTGGVSPRVSLPPRSICLGSSCDVIREVLRGLLAGTVHCSSNSVGVNLGRAEGGETVFAVRGPVSDGARVGPTHLFRQFCAKSTSERGDNAKMKLTIMGLLASGLNNGISTRVGSGMLAIALRVRWFFVRLPSSNGEGGTIM